MELGRTQFSGVLEHPLVVARKTKYKLELVELEVVASRGSSLVWVGAQTKQMSVKRSWSLPFTLKKKRFFPFGFPRENTVSLIH